MIYVRHVYVRRKQKKLVWLVDFPTCLFSTIPPIDLLISVDVLPLTTALPLTTMLVRNLTPNPDHLDELGEWGIIGGVGGTHFPSEGRELVCEWAGDRENQLCTANTSSCHGLQLHIWSGLWGWGQHMLKFSAPEADPALHSFLIFFQLRGGKSSVLNNFCSDHYS